MRIGVPRGLWPAAFAESALAVRYRTRRWARAGAAWIRARTPEQILWVVLGITLLAYLAVLVTASTSTGRGGR